MKVFQQLHWCRIIVMADEASRSPALPKSVKLIRRHGKGDKTETKCTVCRRWFVVESCDSFTRSNCTQRFFLGNRLRFLCGNDTVAVAMHFSMKNGQIFFSQRKFPAISSAIQEIASDCGCDAVVHLGQRLSWQVTPSFCAISSSLLT